ncbi:MAG: YhdT family protein [Fusobacteriales bacterium]|nr:YhdT family protein [Fusobacteriales bacterium]
MKENIRKQIQKEVIITCILYIFYFLWWSLFGFGLGNGKTEEYTYILGLPSWFFCSCILGFMVFSTLVYFSLKYFFKDIALDENFENEEQGCEKIDKQ